MPPSHRVLALCALLCGTLTAACASQPIPPAVLSAVQVELDEGWESISDPTDPAAPTGPKAGREMLTTLNVNDDGVPDWRADYEHSGRTAGLFCGTGGCLQQVYVSRPDGGWLLVFDTQARQFKPRRVEGRPVIDLDFHGTHCGGFGVDPCPRRVAWSERDLALVEVPNLDGETIIRGVSRLITYSPSDLPAPAAAYLAEAQRTCAAVQGKIERPSDMIDRLPDIDGDGVRDWMVSPVYAYCDREEGKSWPSYPSRVYAGGRQVLETQGEVWVDIAGAPAVLLVQDARSDCRDDPETCPRVSYRLDRQDWRLVEDQR